MHTIPNTESHALVLWISSNILFHVAINVDPDARIPNMSFTWDVRIISATAEMKPEDTGPEIKSIRKPEKEEYDKTIDYVPSNETLNILFNIFLIFNILDWTHNLNELINIPGQIVK